MKSDLIPAGVRPGWIPCSVILLAGVLARGGTAQARAPVRSITLADAIRLAIAENPDSRSVDEDVSSAGGALTQARALPNPSLFVSALGETVSPLGAPTPNQFGITWSIPLGGKRGAGIAMARADVAVAQATRVASRRQLTLAVEKAFISVLLDQTQLAFAKEDQAGSQQELDLEELRYKDGKIAYGEVLKLRIQQHAVEDTTLGDELTLASDRAELARLTGQALDADFVVVGNLVPPAALPKSAADAAALQHRPDYRALEAAEQSAKAALSGARRVPIPDLGVLLDYNRIPGTSGSYDFQLSVSIPLFDRNRGAITQAEATAHKTRLATESLRNQIHADLLVASRTWQAARTRLRVYDQARLTEASESLEISKHAYEEGRGTLLDYLDAVASYRDVQRGYHAAVADAMLAAANLRYASGEELP